jgi:hypothetical protein
MSDRAPNLHWDLFRGGCEWIGIHGKLDEDLLWSG